MPTQMPSTAHDLARGKRSEIGHLYEFIVRRGETVSIATSVNRFLPRLMRLLEKSRPIQQGGTT